MRTQRRTHGPAFSLLELQVAFVVLGIALSGLFPLLIMQSRQLRRLESRLDPARSYYLAPSQDEWARKLGAQATLTLTPPAPPPPPPVMVLDNGAGNYSETGTGWLSETRSDAYGGNNRYHAQGTGTNRAGYLFTGLRPGWYEIWATWSPGTDRASNTPYTAYDGSTSRGTFQVKQKVPPKDGEYDGRPWDRLGLVPLAGTSLLVELSDQADGRVVADGVRLLEVRNTVRVLSLQRAFTTEEMTAEVTMSVVTP